jgi:hypothetical protein
LLPFVEKEHAAVRSDVQDARAERIGKNRSHLSREGHSVDLTIRAHVAGGEPNLVALSRPCQPLDGGEFLCQLTVVAGVIDDGNPSAIIAVNRMLEEGDLFTRVGDAKVIHVAGAGIKHFARGIFELHFPVDLANYGKGVAIGCIVCRQDIFLLRAGSAADHLGFGHGARHEPGVVGRIDSDFHRSAGGEGEKNGAGQVHFGGLRKLFAHGENLQRIIVPLGAVDDGLAIAGKTGVGDIALLVGEPGVLEHWAGGSGMPDEPGSGEQQRGSKGRYPGKP